MSANMVVDVGHKHRVAWPRHISASDTIRRFRNDDYTNLQDVLHQYLPIRNIGT